MTFVDSNIPMYVRGREHVHKSTAKYLLERAAVDGERLVTDAEVLQEIIHRYTALNQRNEITPTIRYLLRFIDQVFPIEREDAVQAADLVRMHVRVSARDAIHLAIFKRHRIEQVMSFDTDFDGWPGVTRIHSV